MTRILAATAAVTLAMSLACAGLLTPSRVEYPPELDGMDLTTLRKHHRLRFEVKEPAPGEYVPNEPVADGASVVTFPSGDLTLRGWLSDVPQDGSRRPAVVYLHGGYAFGAADWDDARPVVDKGYVLFIPTLRGENGNAGFHQSFLGEVDDAVAAGRFVASLPGVDPDRVFVVGHSVGATLAVLVSLVPSPYRAAAAYEGVLDIQSTNARLFPWLPPYDYQDPVELKARDASAFPGDVRIPLRLYSGFFPIEDNLVFHEAALASGAPVEHHQVMGDHMEMVAPALEDTLLWFDRFEAPAHAD